MSSWDQRSDWSFACPDWRERLFTGRSLVPDLPLNFVEADRAVSIFDNLRLPDVAGRPLLADTAGDWFRDIVRAIFGSLDRDGLVRHVTDVFVLVPKKNSKTTYAAALMLTALLINERPQALFGLFGPTQEISARSFKAVAGMVKADPDLDKILDVKWHKSTIINRLTKAELKVTTFDPTVATGGLYAGWLLDELHILSSSPYAADVIGQLRGSRASVTESFGVIITTQSERPPAGAFKDELAYARKVRDGVEESVGLLPVLYEFPEDIQTDKLKPWLNPALWPMVQPNIGRSVNLSAIQKLFTVAKAKGESEIRRWASQHLNIQIGLALHSERWRGADYWEAAAEPALTLDSLIERCEVATVGIDGGGLDDLLAIAVIGRCAKTKRWLHWGHAWVDWSILDLRPGIASHLEQFAAEGDLTFVDIGEAGSPDSDLPVSDSSEDSIDDLHEPTGSPGTDAADGGNDVGRTADTSYLGGLVSVVKRLWDARLLPDKYGIGLDPVGVAAIQQALIDAEIPEECLTAISQGFRLSGTISGISIRLKAETFRHCGRPMMAWCVGNAKSELKGSALLVTKQTAGAAKIDPLMALFDAAELMARNPQAGGSVYSSERGLIQFG